MTTPHTHTHTHAPATFARLAWAALLLVLVLVLGAPPADDQDPAVRIAVTGPGSIVQGEFACSGDCAWEGDAGASVSFEAVPDSGYVFVAWGGDCPAALDDTCTRTLQEGDAITATFAPHALRLHLAGDGEGAFRIEGGAIDVSCDADCGVPLDQPLQLAITHDQQGTTGTDLGAWTGACEGADMINYCLVDTAGATDVGKTWRHPPVASADGYETQRDTPLDVDAADGVLANDEDSPDDTLLATLVSDVAHGTLDLRADGSLAYAPDTRFVGQDGFTYRVRDAFGNEDTADVTIDVTPGEVDRAPTAQDDSYATTRNAPLTVAATDGVLANDSDPDGDTLTATLADDVENGTLTLRADGSFDYDPEGYVGIATFTYRASDGVATSDVAFVTIVVSNRPPVATPDSYTRPPNRTLRIDAGEGVLTNDSDPDGDALTAILVEDVDHGSLELRADGSFTYSPDRPFDRDDAFTYRASDGADTSATTTVTISVDDDDDDDDD